MGPLFVNSAFGKEVSGTSLVSVFGVYGTGSSLSSVYRTSPPKLIPCSGCALFFVFFGGGVPEGRSASTSRFPLALSSMEGAGIETIFAAVLEGLGRQRQLKKSSARATKRNRLVLEIFSKYKMLRLCILQVPATYPHRG